MALAIALCALVGFWSIIAALVVLIALSVAAILVANNASRRENDEKG